MGEDPVPFHVPVEEDLAGPGVLELASVVEQLAAITHAEQEETHRRQHADRTLTTQRVEVLR